MPVGLVLGLERVEEPGEAPVSGRYLPPLTSRNKMPELPRRAAAPGTGQLLPSSLSVCLFLGPCAGQGVT